jgi:polar amino acid transport system substrate-binding protein
MNKLAAAGLGALALAGCTASASAATPPTMKPGELTVAFGDPAVGFAKGTLRGSTYSNPRGYEVDLAVAIAKQLSIPASKIHWIYTPWAGLFRPGSKNFDLSFQEATITAQRKKTVTFSAPYLDANQGVLIGKGVTAPKTIADLKKLQTCAQTTTTGLDWITTKLHPVKKVEVYQSTATAFTAVATNRCDAIVLDVPIVGLQKKAAPSQYGPVAGQIITHEQYGAVMPKDSKLAPAVDAAVRKLGANGTLGQLQKRWFSIDFSKVPVLK